jgi:hypothetical protein
MKKKKRIKTREAEGKTGNPTTSYRIYRPYPKKNPPRKTS